MSEALLIELSQCTLRRDPDSGASHVCVVVHRHPSRPCRTGSAGRHVSQEYLPAESKATRRPPP